MIMDQTMLAYMTTMTLLTSNMILLGWALVLKEKNRRLSKELLKAGQWNWRQAKQWRN